MWVGRKFIPGSGSNQRALREGKPLLSRIEVWPQKWSR